MDTDTTGDNCALVAIGPLPPPVTGESVAFESLVSALQKRGFKVEVVRLASQSADVAPLRTQFSRYIQPTLMYLRVLRKKPKIVYLTMAQSAKGFFRDARSE